MATTISYINPVAEVASAQEGISQAFQDNSFAEQLSRLAIMGYGDPNVARHLLGIARSMVGNEYQREEFWMTVLKGEKDSMKKGWELMKD
ncbi:MAG: hypothetical protein HYY52_05245 [Candidatus Melainabacteria bacterium]|nr:hypothetical protein [Candidatus Melainabacteria bacterium]